MSIKVMSWVWENGPKDPTERLTLLALADWADDAGSCYPSMIGIAEKTGVTERGARGIVRRLEANGWIIIKTGGGRGGKNVYRVVMAKPGTTNPEPETGNDVKTRNVTTQNPERDCTKPGTAVPPNRQEPSRNHAARGQEGQDGDRILNLRAGLIQAMGLTGSEFNTSGTFVVRSMSPAELQLSLDVWSKDGLTDQQIIAAVSAKMQAERERDGSFLPKSVRFFDGAIGDHSKRLKRSAGKAATTTTGQTETREQRSKRYARMIGS